LFLTKEIGVVNYYLV